MSTSIERHAAIPREDCQSDRTASRKPNALAVGAEVFQVLTGDPASVLGWDSSQYLVYVFGFAVLASVLRGLYPAWKAANDPPVEVLRS